MTHKHFVAYGGSYLKVLSRKLDNVCRLTPIKKTKKGVEINLMGGSGPCHLIELFRLGRYLIIVKLKLATTP